MTYTFNDWSAGARPPKGWDAADAVRDGWTKADLDGFMRATVKPWSPQPPEKKALAEKASPEDRPAAHAGPSTPAREARTTQQAEPQQATVTHLHTRKTYAADDNWQSELVCNEEGNIKPNVTKNWALFLENHPDLSGVFAWDAFKLRVMLLRKPPWDWAKNWWEPRVLQDRDFSEAVMWLEAKRMTPKASNIAAVIQTVAERSSFDRLSEYLGGLAWDQKPRLETWLSYYLGIEDGAYPRAVGKRWLISSVARGLTPGSKVDTMPILEGPQGLNKSTAVKELYGKEFFSDNLSDIGSKDAMMEMQGVWGLEVAEMHRFSAAETNAVKKFLSRDIDRFRPPYGRSVIDAPRRVVMVGTINPEGNAYLRDPTGARRFWPLTCGRIDLEAIATDRDQLWAEAVHLFKAGTPWWVQEDEQEAVVAEQEKRTDVDVWVDIIAPMVKGQKSISQLQIFEGLGIQKREADWRHAGRVGRIMKKLGWVVGRDRKNNEDKVMFYRPDLADDDQGEAQSKFDRW